MKYTSLPVWLLRNLASNAPVDVYEEIILNCSDFEIDSLSQWLAHLMREFDDALIDV